MRVYFLRKVSLAYSLIAIDLTKTSFIFPPTILVNTILIRTTLFNTTQIKIT
jgi:hypothetical protein